MPEEAPPGSSLEHRALHNASDATADGRSDLRLERGSSGLSPPASLASAVAWGIKKRQCCTENGTLAVSCPRGILT